MLFLMSKVPLYRRIAVVEAAAESEQRHAATSAVAFIDRLLVRCTPTTSWVFNWRADGWPTGWEQVKSESHDFGKGVAGACSIMGFSGSCYMNVEFSGVAVGKCRVHAMFSILDTHDKTLGKIAECGTANTPQALATSFSKSYVFAGTHLIVTAAEKARSVRADGSIRLRAEVRLFV